LSVAFKVNEFIKILTFITDWFNKLVELIHEQLALYVVEFNVIEHEAIFVSIKELSGNSIKINPLAGTLFYILKLIV
jgi:hypothetical protein